MNIEVRQGIEYRMIKDNGRRNSGIGLVVAVQNDCVDVIPVAAIYENGIRMAYCYDEPEASSLHKHNVRLKNSPDVFTAINRIIDINNILRLDNVYVKADWDEVMHHLSVSQPQKEKSVGRVAAAEALLKNIHSDFDKDDGYQRG